MKNRLQTAIACLLIASGSTSIAQTSQKFGDWNVSASDGVSIANTTNGSGSSIGVLCIGDGDTCAPYLAVSVGCEDKAVYPIIINSPVGAAHASTTCATIAGNKYHLINEISVFNAALESGGEIGFAFPMQSGQFQVSRFSTRGGIAAVKTATRFAGPSKSTANLKDQSL